MGEVRKPAQLVTVKYMCDNCGQGEMLFNGYVLTSSPPKYPHTCPRCGHKQNLSKCYPTTEAKEK